MQYFRRCQADHGGLRYEENRPPIRLGEFPSLPTPVGPEKMKLAIGRFGSEEPTRARRIALDTRLRQPRLDQSNARLESFPPWFKAAFTDSPFGEFLNWKHQSRRHIWAISFLGRPTGLAVRHQRRVTTPMRRGTFSGTRTAGSTSVVASVRRTGSSSRRAPERMKANLLAQLHFFCHAFPPCRTSVRATEILFFPSAPTADAAYQPPWRLEAAGNQSGAPPADRGFTPPNRSPCRQRSGSWC